MPHLPTNDGADIVHVTIRCKECRETFKHYPITGMGNLPDTCSACGRDFPFGPPDNPFKKKKRRFI